MIKYFTTNANNTQLEQIRSKCSTNKYTGIVVSKDKRKIYIQPNDNTSGFSIGQAEFLINITSCYKHDTLGLLLEPGMSYLQNDNYFKFYINSANFGIKDGDVINLYLTRSGTVQIFKSNDGINPFFSSPISVVNGSFALVKIVYNSGAWTGYLTAGGGALEFATDTWNNISANFTSNRNEFQPLAMSALYNGVSGLLTNSGHAFWNGVPFYFNGSVISGSKSIAPSTLPYARYESSLTPTLISAGVVTLLDVDTGLDNGYPNGILTGRLGSWEQPLNAITTVKYVHGQEYLVLSTIFNNVQYTEPKGMKQGAAASLVRTNILPSAAANGTYGITTLESGITSGTVKDSPYPWQASSAYKFISGVIDGLDLSDDDALTAVTFNGTKHNGVNRIANIGTVSATFNGHTVSADTTNLINLGTSIVEITQGGTTNKVGKYVQRTATGYQLADGISTLSSTYSTVTNNILTVDGNAIPIMIQTNLGNIYPLEKGSLSAGTGSNAGKFLIDTRPYMAYDNQDSFTGPWTVYYGAGINDLYTTANTVVTGTINSSTYSALFNTADVHVLSSTGTGTTTLTIPDLPTGHGMIIKFINTSGRTIKFGNDTLISSAGQYSASFFNFGPDGGGTQRIGEVTNVYG